MLTKSDKYFLGLVRRKLIEIDYNTGIVYSQLSGYRKPVGAKQSSGYLHMSAGPTRNERNYILLHRLIWLSVNGEVPDRYEVNHKNGNKRDNRLSNIEIVTRSDNVKHALHTLGKVFGVVLMGGGFHGRRTSKAEIDEILALYDSGMTNQSEISRRTGVNRPVVNRIVNKRRR